MIHFQENVNVKRNKVSKKKTKEWKGREAYTKGASFGALCALNTVDPHNITSCIHLHIEVLCRCSNPYFCIVKPTTTITISIKLYNLNKIYCAWILKIHHVQSKFKTKKQKNWMESKENWGRVYPTASGRPEPPRGRSTPARIPSWRRLSWALSCVMEGSWPAYLYLTLRTALWAETAVIKRDDNSTTAETTKLLLNIVMAMAIVVVVVVVVVIVIVNSYFSSSFLSQSSSFGFWLLFRFWPSL